MNPERERIEEASQRERHWRRWGPYLSERAWGTVREDYSALGTAWDFLPHDHARSKAYRWGEDGLAGICDNHQRLCFALALWNERDPILKERLFGLDGNQANHGEDVKELYYYLDSTPTHSYMKCLYKYPQAAFPYGRLANENRLDHRGRDRPEFELLDTGIFDENRYFDVFTEYAKVDVNDILIRITVANRGPAGAPLHLLPTIWFRNSWAWGYDPERPEVRRLDDRLLECNHSSMGAPLGQMYFSAAEPPRWLFTDNDTNTERLYNYRSSPGWYKDAFHERVIGQKLDAVRPDGRGTKACAWYVATLEPGEERVYRFRLSDDSDPVAFDAIFERRREEADRFYSFAPSDLTDDARAVQRQAYAGLLWSKQFYHYVVGEWLEGDPGQPRPPEGREQGRNRGWIHLYNEDVLSMPDKWEYPWFAAWDSAFHMITMATVDPDFAKAEMARFLREWYMHPNGQIPAYEWAFDDVNPPVHAWACYRVFKIDSKLTGRHDWAFLETVFHKLLMNFTWWVNRKDSSGDNIFEGGFLGLDNIGLFDRSKPLPTGGSIEQSDGTSWMAMYCLNMLRIALELSVLNPAYEDIASKFFEHFLFISSAMNHIGGRGLWDEADGFYYDRLQLPDQRSFLMKVRSMVGLIPLFAVETIDPEQLDRAPGFKRRMQWFIENRKLLCGEVASITDEGVAGRRLLAICHAHRLRRLLARMLDESEFLSPHGIRSLSRYHADHPYSMQFDGTDYGIAYDPGESSTWLFGGNSNWRGPVWFPVNYLIIESLQKFNHYFGREFQVEFPTGSGNMVTLGEAAAELSRRLSRIFLRDQAGRRPVYGNIEKFQSDPHFRDHVLFYEYFHGDTGLGLGASHQTGWTALVAKLLQQSGV
ncbi:MAG: glucosidase [Bryobacteraceae bacterium]